MEQRILIPRYLNAFRDNLIREEKSEATIEKYLRDVKSFRRFVMEQNVTKEQVVSYKKELQEKGMNITILTEEEFFELFKREETK